MSIRYLSGIDVDNNTLFVDDANNRVGIGTNGPQTSLDVQGSINIKSTFNLTWGGPYGAGTPTITGSSISSFISFYPAGSTSGETMRITSAGNVGIGTTTPSEKLVVSDNGAAGFEWIPSSGRWYRFNRSTSAYGGIYSEASEFTWSPYGSEAMRINGLGNVGIGYTNPAYKLEVNGLVAADRYILNSVPTNSFQGSLTALFGDSTYNILAGPANGPIIRARWSGGTANRYLEFGQTDNGGNYTASVRIVEGNVGIGTTSPTYKLDVVGEGRTSSAFMAGGAINIDSNLAIQITSAGAGTQRWIGINKNNGYGLIIGYLENAAALSGVGAYIRQVTSDPIHFLVNNATTAMSIVSSGNVGIGTTSPGDKLHVNAGGTGGIRIQADSEPSLYLNTTDGAANATLFNSYGNVGLVGYATSTNYIMYHYGGGGTLANQYTYFQTAGAERMRINGAGNVGIGNTSPNGALSFADDVNTRKIVLWDGAANNNYQFYGLGVESSTFINSIYDTADRFLWVAGSGSTSRSEVMVLTGAGRLGIGTTSPVSKLQVSGTNVGSPLVTITETSAAADQFSQLEFAAGNRRGYIWLGNENTSSWAGAGGLNIYTANGNMDLWTGATQRVRITNDGNVGIGTTAPGNNLHVYNASGATIAIDGAGGNNTGLQYKNNGSLEAAITYVPATSQLHIFRGGDVMVIGSSNVGIGTTAPTAGYKLDVVGSILSQVASGNTSIVVSTNNANGAMNAIAGSGLEIATDSTNQNISFRTGASSRMYIKSDGNVGIGTTSPSQKLHVAGKGYFENNVVITPKSESWAEGLSFVMPNTSTWGGLRWRRERVGNDGNWAIGFTALDSTDDLVFSANNGGTQVDNIIRLTKAGNVGIGNSNPGSLLQVGNAGSAPTGLATLTLNGANTAPQIATKPGLYHRHAVGLGVFSDYAISFQVNGYSALSDAMYIGNTGAVGIGTTSPSSRLHLSGTSTSIMVTDTTYNRTSSIGYLDSANLYFANDPASNTLIGAYNSVFLAYGGGNVGIGTTAPATKLHVVGQTTLYNGASNALLINTDVLDNNTRDAIYLYEDDAQAFGRQAISWYNGNQSYYKARLWTEVGGGYAATTFGIDVADDARNVATRLAIRNGNVGIGTTAPAQKLHVAGKGLISNAGITGTPSWANNSFEIQSSSGQTVSLEFHRAGYTSCQIWSDGNNLIFGTASGTERMRVQDANLGIGTTSPSYPLHVVGTSYVGALGVGVAPNGTFGRIDASNDIVAFSSSDERLKKNITPIANALEKVKTLTGIEFDWKEELVSNHGYTGRDTGIIAQQVQAIMPTAVRTNDTGYLAVRYERLIGLLIEAMKEQQTQIDELKSRLDGASS